MTWWKVFTGCWWATIICLLNIGNPDEISLLDFAKEILTLTGNQVKIVFKELPVDDPKQREPDITKAKALLDWEPKVKRKEGLRITYDYFQIITERRIA